MAALTAELMEKARSVTGLHPKPTVDPMGVTVFFPVHGTDDDMFTLSVNNPTEERLVFKITCTKASVMSIRPQYGFVEPKDNRIVEFVPVPIPNDDGWNKTDNITVLVACCPPGELWKAKDIWEGRNKPKDNMTFVLKLVAQYGRPPPKANKPPTFRPSTMPKTPPPMMMMSGGGGGNNTPVWKTGLTPTSGSGGKSPAPGFEGHVYKSKDAQSPSKSPRILATPSSGLSVDPTVMILKVPCKGTADENQTITINNSSMERYTWCLKGSKVHLFAVAPQTRAGFVEPMGQAVINVQPRRAPDPNTFNDQDALDVMVATCPPTETDAKAIWDAKAAFKVNQPKTLKVKLRPRTDAQLAMM